MNSAPRPAIDGGVGLRRSVGGGPRGAHGLHPRDDALDGAQIAARAHVAEPGRGQQRGRRRRLPGADLQRQRAARGQQRGRGGDQPAHQRQPVGAAVERQRRLGSHLGRQAAISAGGMYGRLAAISVERRVRRPAARPRSPSTKVTGDAVPLGVGARHLQRAGRDVDGDDGRRREQLGERHRDGARAGADVGDARGGGPDGPAPPALRGPSPDRPARPAAVSLARLLDQRLGVGARHQHARVDGELEAPELLLADEVGDRLARLAPLDELADGGELVGAAAGDRTARRAARAADRARAPPAARRRGAASPAPAPRSGRRSSGSPRARSSARRARLLRGHSQRGHFIRRRSTGTPPMRWRSTISSTSSTFTPPYQTCSG